MKKEQSKGQKQIDRENAESLKFYAIVCAAGILVSFIPPVLNSRSSDEPFVYRPFMLPVFGLSIHALLLKFLQMMTSSGLDINQSNGTGEDFKDIIFVTVACQTLGALFSAYFWWAWALVPCVAFYRLCLRFWHHGFSRNPKKSTRRSRRNRSE